MKYSVLLLILATSCRPDTSVETNDTLLNTTEKYRYLALGDSYTIGESVAPAERWSELLADLLRKEGFGVATPEIIARTGWTTADLAAGIEAAQPKPPYELVSLLIGVNNQYRGQSLERYRTELRDLLNRSVQLAAGRPERVLVLSTPDWGVTPAAAGRDRAQIAREIDAFNEVERQECEKLKIKYVAITPLSRTALNDASQIASDNLHFSGKMYRQWANLILPVAKKMLK